MIDEMRKGANDFEESLLIMCINSDGKLSLSDVYCMPYRLRKIFVKKYNEFVEMQNKVK